MIVVKQTKRRNPDNTQRCVCVCVKLSFSFPTETPLYLVNAIVAVPLLRCVFADASSFGATHHPHRLPRPPVSGLRSIFVIQRCVAVQGQSPVGVGDPEGLTLTGTNSETNTSLSTIPKQKTLQRRTCSCVSASGRNSALRCACFQRDRDPRCQCT